MDASVASCSRRGRDPGRHLGRRPAILRLSVASYARLATPNTGDPAPPERDTLEMDTLKQLPRDLQVVLGGTVLYLIMSFLDWQQVSVGPLSVGVTEWHGIGIVAGLLAMALLAWEAARLFRDQDRARPAHTRAGLGRPRAPAPAFHRDHVPVPQRLPSLARVPRPPPLDRRRGRGRPSRAQPKASRCRRTSARRSAPRRQRRLERGRNRRRPGARLPSPARVRMTPTMLGDRGARPRLTHADVIGVDAPRLRELFANVPRPHRGLK